MFGFIDDEIFELRDASLFNITFEKVANEIREVFEKHARDYVQDNSGTSSGMGALFGINEEEKEGYTPSGSVNFSSMDHGSHLEVEIGSNGIIIGSVKIKHGISRAFLDELVPCIRKCAARLEKYHEIVFRSVEDETIKKWCMDHGYEEIVRDGDGIFRKKIYSYVLHVGDECPEVRDYWNNIDTRREMYEALIESEGLRLKGLLQKYVCSYLSMENPMEDLMERSVADPSGSGDDWIGSLSFLSYDVLTDVRISFYTNSIVIHRFQVREGTIKNIRKCLDECVDQIVKMAKYVVDIESIVFQDVEHHDIQSWCLENGYKADGTDMALRLSDGPLEEQLHCKEARLLTGFLSTFINVSDYDLVFYALNHEVEKEISAPDLMDELIDNEGRYSKYEFWEIKADKDEISSNEICYDMVDPYRDGRRINNAVEIYYGNGMLCVKLNIDLDIIQILPEGSIRSIDIMDKNGQYLLRIVGSELMEGRYIGLIVYDLREHKFYNISQECKVHQWEAVQ